jgi:hypothetical protein
VKYNCVLGISLLSEVVASTLYVPSFLTRGWKDFWMWSCWIQIILKRVVREYELCAVMKTKHSLKVSSQYKHVAADDHFLLCTEYMSKHKGKLNIVKKLSHCSYKQEWWVYLCTLENSFSLCLVTLFIWIMNNLCGHMWYLYFSTIVTNRVSL